MARGGGEGGGFAANDVALTTRVACRTDWTMVLMSTLVIGVRGEAGGVWGASTVGDGTTKDGLEETTGEGWSQYCIRE